MDKTEQDFENERKESIEALKKRSEHMKRNNIPGRVIGWTQRDPNYKIAFWGNSWKDYGITVGALVVLYAFLAALFMGLLTYVLEAEDTALWTFLGVMVCGAAGVITLIVKEDKSKVEESTEEANRL
eukprot:TRINITY_DN774347_c0_g1_i1.p1 TRINITY_DN774347_c0_g1~~TRINITY_DN774347_c0_g1_i1.p1  ORF type:complete len:149 (-),score=36.16 TRINITY_DN774347_c0_g1_i1:143-523(-)